MFAMKSILLVNERPGAATPALQRALLLAAEHDGRCDTFEAPDGGDALAPIAAAAAGADLVVLGARRRNLLREIVSGTPAERLVRMSRRPVLVVRRPATTAYRRVLVPVDLERGSEAAVRLAGALAPSATLHLFHALNAPMESRLRLAGASEAALRRHRDAARAASLRRLWTLAPLAGGAPVQVEVGHGAPVWLTLAQATAVDADLVVVGKEGSSTLCDFLLGSVTRQLLAESSADVLVLPKAAHAQPRTPPDLIEARGVAPRTTPRTSPAPTAVRSR
jgi:nucleotide-binding universal stress UspA family protein